MPIPSLIPLIDIIKWLISMLGGDDDSESEGTEDTEDTSEFIEASKCGEEDGQPCTCNARVLCTSAEESESVHIIREIDGHSVKLADIEQLNQYDIKREKTFAKCKWSPDRMCTLSEEFIEGGAWQDRYQGFDMGEDEGVLDENLSYMVCTYGEGIIYFEDAGQSFKSYVEEMEAELEKDNGATTISEQYLLFLINYEAGGSDIWRYAEDVGDGTITIAFGVVLKAEDGTYPLTKEVYDYYMERKRNKIPLTYDEAYELTETRLGVYIEEVNKKAEENGWVLTPNRFDALVDMDWNLGYKSLEYNASELLATGDLTDDDVVRELEREILETATFTKTNGEKVWAKNLVERRLDVIRIAQGGKDAYTRNEMDPDYWNENAYNFLLEKGIDKEKLDKYPIQQVKVK